MTDDSPAAFIDADPVEAACIDWRREVAFDMNICCSFFPQPGVAVIAALLNLEG